MGLFQSKNPNQIPKSECIDKHIGSLNKDDLLKKIEASKIDISKLTPENAQHIKRENISYCLSCGIIVVEGKDKHMANTGHFVYETATCLVCHNCGYSYKDEDLPEKVKDIRETALPLMTAKFVEATMAKLMGN